MEGSYLFKPITHEHDAYEGLLKILSPRLSESDLGPDILPADTRFKTSSEERRTVELYAKIMYSLSALRPIGFTYIPNTLEEAAHRYLQGLWINDRKCLRDVPENILKFIDESDKRDTEMEKHMLAMAERYAPEYDQVLVVTGGAHTLEMHRRSKLPYEILYKPNNKNELGNHYSMLLMRKGRSLFY